MNNIFLQQFYEEVNDTLYPGYIAMESVISTPMSKWIKKIKEIKEKKPDQLSEPEEVKKFIDKYGDDIEECAKLLEEDVSKINEDNIKYLIATTVAILASYALMLTTVPALAITGIVSLILTFILSSVATILNYFKLNADDRCAKELRKIKKSLKDIAKNKKIKESTRSRILKIVSSIDDAESEYTSKLKVEESVNMYNIIAYKLQSKIDAGELTLEDANIINDMAYDKYCAESSSEYDLYLDQMVNELF